MSKLLNQFGEPIESTPKPLPSTEQILQDPITKKFVFLNSDAHPDQTCIGLTGETDFHGVVYKYGKVTLPEELASEEEIEKSGLPFKFEYDIVDNNGWKQEDFKEDFFELIGDILVDIITTEEPYVDNDRTDSTI